MNKPVSPKSVISIDEEIYNFFQRYPLLKFKKGELIYRPEEKPETVSFIKSGYVKQYLITKNGQEIILNIVKPVFYFSLLNAINNSVNKYYFEALTEVHLWRVNKKAVLDFVESHPKIMLGILKNFANCSQEILNKFEFTITASAFQKVVYALLSFINCQENASLNKPITLQFKLTQQNIACMAGLTRETTSMQIGILRKRKMIEKKGDKLTLLDPKKMCLEMKKVI